MNAPPACPACGSHDADEIGTVGTEALSAAYRAPAIGVDIARLLPNGLGHLSLMRCKRCDLQWFSPTVEGDPAFYQALQEIPWYYENDKPEHAHVASLVRSLAAPVRLLEVGCGQGAFGVRVALIANYRGLEFNTRAVTGARAKGLDVVRRSIAEEAEAAPAHYDVVCHFQVLEHVRDVRGFMQACKDALRPGGLLVACVPADDSFARLVVPHWLNMPPHHLTRWSDNALNSLYHSLGLETIELWHEPVADIHREWYINTMARFGLSSLFGQVKSLDGIGLASRTADRLSLFAAVRKVLFKFGERRSGFAGRGHAVVAVGRKPHL